MGYKLTKKQKMAEIVKCGKDPAYFINNYCSISHPIRGHIPFKTYDYQDQLLTDFNQHRFTVILKARQLGISTIVAGYAIWMMLFHKDKNILVMATKFATATNLVKKVKSMLKSLPDWIAISDIKIDNRASFELANGSQIKASTSSSDAGRSEALSLLIVDEAAHIDNMDEIWAAIYPTISTGGRCIALSTPFGVGNWFHQAYIDAEAQQNNFYPIELRWDAHPDRDDEWFERETGNMSKRDVAQELLCSFNASGETVIHSDDMTWLETTVKEPKYKTGHDRNYWIWEEYQPDFTYLVVADVARGDGADCSVFQVVKLETMEVIAEYQGKPSLDLFSQILFQAAKEYGNALLVVENIGIGISVLEKLIEMEYPNLYYSIKSTHEFVNSNRGEADNNAVPGFTTSTKTRPLIVAKFEEFIRNKLINIYSVRVFNETKTFIWKNGKPQAMRGYHDDLIMSLAIACWVRDTALIVNKREIEYKKAMLNSMVKVNTKINTTIPGMEGYDKKEALDEKMFREADTNKQYSWLYKG